VGTDTSIIRGTLDMLILKTVSVEPMHGWGISESIEARSGDRLKIQPGSLYASLHRLTREGWIRSYWADSPAGRRARYYALTPAGAGQLRAETEHWTRLVAGVAQVMALST